MTMEEIKELPLPATPTMQVVKQTYKEGEGWQPNEPTTIEEFMGHTMGVAMWDACYVHSPLQPPYHPNEWERMASLWWS